MQSKLLLRRVKRMEKKVFRQQRCFVFFGTPSPEALAKLPPGASIIVFVGEDEIKD